MYLFGGGLRRVVVNCGGDPLGVLRALIKSDFGEAPRALLRKGAKGLVVKRVCGRKSSEGHRSEKVLVIAEVQSKFEILPALKRKKVVVKEETNIKKGGTLRIRRKRRGENSVGDSTKTSTDSSSSSTENLVDIQEKEVQLC